MALSDGEVDQIRFYLGRLQERLNLEQWTVVVHPEVDTEPNLEASITPDEHSCVAHLRTGDAWASLDGEARRATLTHEMLHLIHRSQTDVIRLGFPATDLIPEATWQGLWALFYTETERMVHALTALIAPTMPRWD